MNTSSFHYLGYRAFWIFFIENSRWFFASLLGTFILVSVVEMNVVDPQYYEPLVEITLLLILVCMITFFGGAAAAGVQYLAFRYSLEQDAFKIKSGILNINVEAIPYRQMQNVDIQRDLLYRFFGLSRLVILTAGTEDAKGGEHSEGIIPALDKGVASRLQEELLQRSNIAKVVDVNHEHTPWTNAQ